MSSRSPASLSAGLLSRKGMAAPSAGPETRANMVGFPLDAPLDAPYGAGSASDATPAETTRPRPPQVPAPARSTLADWVAREPAPSVGAPSVGAPSVDAQDRHDQGAQKRVRVSLRLDEERHTRLKLVATQRNCTLQSLFTAAIDEFFTCHAPDLHGITAHLRGRAAITTTDQNIGQGKRNSEGRNGPIRFR